MTGEHPIRTLDDDYVVDILSFRIDFESSPLVDRVQYAATTEGPDGHVTGFSDTLDPETRIDRPREPRPEYVSIGHVTVPIEEAEGSDVWQDGVPLISHRGDDQRHGVLEVRYDQSSDEWWTVPAYIEVDP